MKRLDKIRMTVNNIKKGFVLLCKIKKKKIN